ncbi:hypothetical protein B0T22DRAFT_452841 [Podospora appendiculata]|uniref:Uncharacterized protein n=1 Tax=Podospora appendiculata TaxID=314037 RepID=A0AAE0XJI4_9PEZI|nr:hypothetical protein B0T22DRAFT_452841 [Podospora appendiculata]
MLLTSSQASVAISSSIVVVFTLALFLSGYAIQQRTLRDLRAAIKPSPRPKPDIFLPDRFKQSTTELEDGTVVALEDDYHPRHTERQKTQRQQQQHGGNGGTVVEIKLTPPTNQAPEKPLDAPTKTAKQSKQQQQQKKKKTKKGSSSSNKEKDAEQEQPQKPISRAERRRLIKEEITRLARGEQKGGYQRRLW